jgi:prepilin-type N-terminal cleavage/methylation domain-containing protein
VIARLRREDDGYSLIELMVVMILLSIISGIVTATLVGTMRTTRQAQNRAYSAADIQNQLERVARDLRVADPIRAASANSITVDDYRGNTCMRETWALTSGNLVRTAVTYSTWSACSLYPATATPVSSVTQTVLPSIANGSTSLFTYEDATGATITGSTTTQIAMVHITFVQAGKEGRAPVSFDTSVGVRNETLQ